MRKITLLTIFVLSTLFVMAGNKPFVFPAKEKEFVLTFAAKSNAKEVKIYDYQENEIFSEKVRGNVTARKYNLDYLDQGIYTFVVEDAHIISKQIVSILDDNRVYVWPTVSELYKPLVTTKNATWNVNLLSLGKFVDIKIYDDADNLLIEENFDNQPKLQRSYNMDKTVSGTYHMTIAIDGYRFHYEFQK